MHTLLRGLRKRALIERAATAPSGRALPTRLTAEGERLLERAQRRVAKVEAAMVHGLEPAEAEELHELLTRCIESLRAEGGHAPPAAGVAHRR